MAALIDTSVWIAFFRIKTPPKLKELACRLIASEQASIAEPINFELLRAITLVQRRTVMEVLETLPLLSTPENLWGLATALGQKCQSRGFNSRPLDLLIAEIAIWHKASLVTFDADFNEIASVSPLQVDYYDPKTHLSS